jgi:glycosyltransferase involved in cell wall biosynthesis
LLNVAAELGEAGRRTLVVGYWRDGLPRIERIGPNARVIRLVLVSRRIPFGILRRIFATIELIWRASRIVTRSKPRCVIAFNDPAVALLSILRVDTRKVAWLLEYPDYTDLGIFEKMLMSMSFRCWEMADIFVTPTIQRLALHYSKRPALMHKSGIVVHNAPSRRLSSSGPETSEFREAKTWIKNAKSQDLLVMVHAGAIGKRYGIDTAIQAVAAVPRVALLILGADHPVAEADIAEALRSCGGCDRVHWVKGVPYRNLNDILRLCDAGYVYYVGDSINRRFSAPGKIYEYLRAGLIVVTDFDACIAGELAVADCAMFFTRPASATRVADALRKLLDRSEEIPAMRQRAEKLFAEVLCVEHQIPNLLRLVEQN